MGWGREAGGAGWGCGRGSGGGDLKQWKRTRNLIRDEAWREEGRAGDGRRLRNESVVIDCIVRVADQGPARCSPPPVHLWTMQSVTPHCSV